MWQRILLKIMKKVFDFLKLMVKFLVFVEYFFVFA
jgi:hypothetical protein